MSDSYAAQPGIHFQTNRVSITSTAITSEDGNTSDPVWTAEEYAPFEGAGVISSRKLSFPSNLQQLKYADLTDLVMRLRDIASIGPVPLENAASCAVSAWAWNRITPKSYYGQALSFLAINLSAEYRGQWEVELGEIEVPNIDDQLPFWARTASRITEKATLYIYPKPKDIPSLEIAGKVSIKATLGLDFGTYSTYDFSFESFPGLASLCTIKDLKPHEGRALSRVWLLFSYSGMT